MATAVVKIKMKPFNGSGSFRAWRERMGLTFEEVAERLGISTRHAKRLAVGDASERHNVLVQLACERLEQIVAYERQENGDAG